MRQIAIIPARAGSKSIPGKNMARVGSKRLIDITLSLAASTPFFREIIISTDISYLFDEKKGDSRVSLLRREKRLGTDDAQMLDVVTDAITKCHLRETDWFWLLQPTSPFREPIDFSTIFSSMLDNQCRSAISVVNVGAYHPHRMYTIKRKMLMPLRGVNFDNKQDLIPTYIRNGAFYVCRVRDFLKTGGFYVKPCFAYEMPPERSINIDSPLDLLLANQIDRIKHARI